MLFIIILGFCLALASAYSIDGECPPVCPRIMDPICAFDGENSFKYFHNDCLMRFNKCRSGRAWSETHMSLCLHEIDPIVLKECLRPCHFIYSPICATDGKKTDIFSNSCVFGMENCFSNQKWTQTRDNECGI